MGRLGSALLRLSCWRGAAAWHACSQPRGGAARRATVTGKPNGVGPKTMEGGRKKRAGERAEQSTEGGCGAKNTGRSREGRTGLGERRAERSVSSTAGAHGLGRRRPAALATASSILLLLRPVHTHHHSVIALIRLQRHLREAGWGGGWRWEVRRAGVVGGRRSMRRCREGGSSSCVHRG